MEWERAANILISDSWKRTIYYLTEFPWGDSYMRKACLIEAAKSDTGEKQVMFFELKYI